MNQHTKFLITLLGDIVQTAKKNNHHFYIAGGFAVDIQAGKITRDHKDIEFYLEKKHMLEWVDLFKNRGFYCVEQKIDLEYVYVVKPNKEAKVKLVDVQAFAVENKYLVNFDSKGQPAQSEYLLDESIEIKDFLGIKNIRVLKKELLLKYKEIKTIKNPNDNDYKDIILLKSLINKV